MNKTFASLALLLSFGAAHAQTTTTSNGTIVLGGATNNAAIATLQTQVNQGITVNGTACAVGGTCTVPSSLSTAQQNAINGAEQTGNKGTAGGYAPLNSNSLVPTLNLPTTLSGDAAAIQSETTNRTTAVSSEATARAAAVLVAQHQAAAISPSDYGVLCNGQVLPIMGLQSNGNYLGTAVVGGTDDTAAIQTWLNALAVHATKSGATTVNLVGVSAEGGANTAFQAVARFPYAAHCLVTSFPNVPEGVELQLNGSEIDVTTAAGSGPSFVSQQNSGQYYVGSATAANLYTNGIYARANDTMRGGRIVYAGPVGASTGKGLRVSNALNESFSDVNVYGFQNCIQIEGVEYSHFDFNHAANCGTGFKFTTSWSPTTPGGVSSPSGGITIDLNGFGNTSRLNGVDYWFNGASAVRLYGGTGAFASKANIILGGAPPDYIDTLTMSGVSSGSYAASTKYPLTFTDAGGGVDFEGVMLTDSNGTPTGVWSTNGGIGMTSQAVVSVAACTTSGCTTPTITAHIATFKGMGDFDTDAGAGLNLIDGMDFESEGCVNGCNNGASVPNGRPSSGFQVISTGGSDSGNILQHITNNIGNTAQEYTRLARDPGGNIFQDFQPSVITDPSTGSSCQIMRGNTGRTTVHLRGGADPATYGCDLTGAADTGGPYLAIDGYDAEIAKRAETELYSGSAAVAPYTVPFKIIVQGETTPRMNFDGAGNIFQGPGVTTAPDTEVGRTGAGTWGVKLGYLSNLPIQWQSQSGGNYSIPLTGDVNNFLTVYNRTTGSNAWYAASSGITFNGNNNTFGFALNSCAQSSTKGVCTTPVNFFTITSAGTDVAGVEAVARGTSIASAATIAPTTGFVHITGTTAISNITPPTNCTVTGYACTVKFLPDAVWTTATGGNIAVASTAVVNRPLTMTYDNTAALWYPSY